MDKPRQKSFSKKSLPLYRRIKLPSQPLSSSAHSSYDNYHKSKNDLLLKRNNQYEAQNKFLSLTQTWTQHTLSLMRQAGVIPGVTCNVKSNSTRNKNISSSILLQKCFLVGTSLSSPIYSQYTQRIDLRNNPLGDQGAKIIAHQVILSGNFQVLEDLNLKSCNIRNSGIRALVSVLSYNEEKQKLVPKLKRVNAKDNRPNPNFLQQLFHNRTIPQCLQL